MKTERRHELQTNVLAHWLSDQVAAIQPYWKLLVAGVLVVVFGGLGYVLLSSRDRASAGASWQEYISAVNERNATKLEGISEDHPNTSAGIWASQSAADMRLATGAGNLYQNRDEAVKPLEEAVELYKRVIAKSASVPMLQLRANLGIAKAYECLSVADGSKAKNKEYLEEAQKHYERVVSDGRDTSVGRAAAERLQALQTLRQGTDEDNFYWWFASQEPIVREPPADMSELAERPSLDPLFGVDLSPDPSVEIPGPDLGPSPDPATDPAKPAANPDADPAKPATDPANPAADPAKPDVDPAKPDVDPAKPAADPAKPAADPANPATDPAKPDEPAADPAKSGDSE